MGIKISTIPVFSAEVSPASTRGGIVTSFQLWVAFGIFLCVLYIYLIRELEILTQCSGFCSNLVFYRIGRLAWRFQLAAAFAPAIPILTFVWFCPGTLTRRQWAFLIFLTSACRIATLADEEGPLPGSLQVLLSTAEHGADCGKGACMSLSSTYNGTKTDKGQYYAHCQMMEEMALCRTARYLVCLRRAK